MSAKKPVGVKAVIEEITRKIVRRFRPLKVVLFGSHANGVPGEDSDIDLLVVMESDKRPAERVAEVSRALRPRSRPLDIIVRTPAEIDYRVSIGDHFILDILCNGRVLYERGAGQGMA